MNKKRERSIVKGCREANHRSYSDLYNMYKNRIYALSVRMLGNMQDAEDATQDIFIRIFKNITGFRGDSALSTWIYRIAMNTCIEFMRKNAIHNKEDPIEDVGYRPELIYESNMPCSFNNIVEQEIRKLPEGYRTAFILHAIEGFKHREISRILDISEGTSKSQYFQAKTLLRTRLRPYLEVLKNEL